MKSSDGSDLETVCRRAGVSPQLPAPAEKVGLARMARYAVPVHGLRVNPTDGVSGWYIWAGEMERSENFFESVHVAHIQDVCPLAVPFLALPPGWRFLTDGEYVDVWFDAEVEL